MGSLNPASWSIDVNGKSLNISGYLVKSIFKKISIIANKNIPNNNLSKNDSLRDRLNMPYDERNSDLDKRIEKFIKNSSDPIFTELEYSKEEIVNFLLDNLEDIQEIFD